MSRYKSLFFYILTLTAFSALIYFVVVKGTPLESYRTSVQPVDGTHALVAHSGAHVDNWSHPLPRLLLQMVVILLAARGLGYLFKKIRQPAVLGEITAGILLGPSFVGMHFPGFTDFLFPVTSLPNLQLLSQVGLVLFMFIIGMELNLAEIRKKAKDAVLISHASIIVPFALGVILSYFIYVEFAPANVLFLPFSMFIGIAMSITAFPVLARIVQERGLFKTRLGMLVITCAAADDVTAWCVLAAVIAIVHEGSAFNSIYVILMVIAYLVIMLVVAKPLLAKLIVRYSGKTGNDKSTVVILFATLLISAYITETIGIHALFGAFMAGAIMPPETSLKGGFAEKVEDVTLVLLLPVIFVISGLRTEINLLNEPHLWMICALVIAVAIIGKFAGSALAARITGQSWHDSLSIGALMNTRGLMQLVVLNIGYDLGVLSAQLFSMMIVMALITTFMTGPVLNAIDRYFGLKPNSGLQHLE